MMKILLFFFIVAVFARGEELVMSLNVDCRWSDPVGITTLEHGNEAEATIVG